MWGAWGWWHQVGVLGPRPPLAGWPAIQSLVGGHNSPSPLNSAWASIGSTRAGYIINNILALDL